MADMTWRKAILRALNDLGGEAHYADIAQEIIDRGYRSKDSIGATPANTVAANISMHLKDQLLKVSPGRYRLLDEKPSTTSLAGDADQPVAQPPSVAPGEGAADDHMGLINAFGMFWRREEVHWQGKATRLRGVQQDGATPTDFAGQAGVYILYDGNRVVYVGRVTATRLGHRLAEHTRDRLSARWDRFSWFGVRPVEENGTLGAVPAAGISVDTLIATMEALLIEGIEPPQNRRQGDGFNAVEFIQAADPDIEERRRSELIGHLLSRGGR